MKPRGGGNRNAGHRSAVLFVGGSQPVGFAYRLHPRLCSGHASGVHSKFKIQNFPPRLRCSFKIQNLQEKSDSGDERETKRQFGVLREFLYFCSPKQKVVDP